MSMQTATAQLVKATKILLHNWDQATEQWNDPVSKRIEEKHIAPLSDSVKIAVGAMESMGEAIVKAHSDCS